ncbi:hypothetical protein DIPPA_27313 [Diplonema papillatum]|nr:hypothetical protein DIPPA_27313 [Diplonema papillatum]
MLSASRKLLLQATSWRPVDAPEKAVLVCAHHYGGQHGGRLDELGGIAPMDLKVTNSLCLTKVGETTRRRHLGEREGGQISNG